MAAAATGAEAGVAGAEAGAGAGSGVAALFLPNGSLILPHPVRAVAVKRAMAESANTWRIFIIGGRIRWHHTRRTRREKREGTQCCGT